ncbi:MAG: large-conductance mechanosensitive channel protein MscL [Saprospiraceae bacterium]|jgi:large conductance mechanosensitive channel|uniref:large-conductance mechanosensitive channel protein MscL n=1 Tax=Candidatus Brachybacter algidus TaxID=2982024 RepID=UPI001B435ABC|nr:large-conductance mechanosensitive channel protein MscL [Candidatus Brachybacter algidus]MBP7540465.1 large-conductance mechanosensitive channel protein MscL [Saprospiraceae bacterium]MBK6447871.1 large-conductance mechanosensitive channel protein MscL [Candidatus Brachybacter algidus]MBK7602682.1 large-conductance mechanosensitive channel protein MscL [Candidatus Brachybacter algidus]MBK8354663.1 large-conductance mechanosensitive channel protein MscL [Candidatus Brachybacter algidus]MBK86
MSVLKEFKDFAMRGNLVDMAIGVVMAGAFGKVVSAFIDGMVMPAVGMLTGGVDFTQQKIVLKEAVAASADGVAAVDEVAIKYGDFITQTISFLVVAMVVFIIIKAINRMKEKQEAAPEAGPSSTDTLLMEIRDELKRRG